MSKIYTAILALVLANMSFAQLNVTPISNFPYDEQLSDVWGYVDGDGNEYALVGVYNRFSIVDLSDPANPKLTFEEDGPRSIWRDMKVWNNHAYITHDGTDGGDQGVGLLIVDLSTLPADTNLAVTYYTGDNYPFSKAHNIYIDENGIAYVYGADYSNGGVIMLDLNNDPKAPVEIGLYDDYYVHDGFVRGDTLWASCITDGIQVTVDISNKSNLVTLATWSTPNDFAHNCWLSDDGKYIYTTDEKPFAYIAAYDVTNMGNVQELDRWQSNPGTGTIPHNVHFMDEYIITSYYADGLTICDVSDPSRIVEVGNYDTSPDYEGDEQGGFHGAWGAYPWLPSGLILISDMETGLHVLQPDYQRACYLEGNITDSLCGYALQDVKIEILTPDNATTWSAVDGTYDTGTPYDGTYDVRITKTAYDTLIVSNVQFVKGSVTLLDVKLYSTSGVDYSGTIADSTGTGIENAVVVFENGERTYAFTTDNNGDFSQCGMIAGTYDLRIGSWGYITKCIDNVSISGMNNIMQAQLEHANAYYDDFSVDLGWTAVSTASAGKWERGEPNATAFGPSMSNAGMGADTTDCVDMAWVTGNAGGSAGDDDVDNGKTTLISPLMDFPTALRSRPHVEFYTWFFNAGGAGNPDDYLKVSATNGIDTTELLMITPDSAMSEWRHHVLDIPYGSNVQIIVEVEDHPSNGHILEGGFDGFRAGGTYVGIEEVKNNNSVGVYPNPFKSAIYMDVMNFDLSNNLRYKITDIMGKEILSAPINQSTSKVEINKELPKGLYLVSIVENNKIIQVEKLIHQ